MVLIPLNHLETPGLSCTRKQGTTFFFFVVFLLGLAFHFLRLAFYIRMALAPVHQKTTRLGIRKALEENWVRNAQDVGFGRVSWLVAEENAERCLEFGSFTPFQSRT